MKRHERLRSRRDFDAVFREGRRAGEALLGLRVRENGLPYSRAGFICGKAVGGAVVRNRVKRRLREAFRQAPVASGLDIVVVARPPAAAADYHELETSLRRLLRRLQAMKRES